MSRVCRPLERCCGGRWPCAVKVHRLLSSVGALSGSSFNDSSAAATAWVVAMVSCCARCVGEANATVNNDASSLLYRPAEADHLYTARLDVLCRLIAGCTLHRALWYVDCSAANYTQAIERLITSTSQEVDFYPCGRPPLSGFRSRSLRESFPGFEKIV